MRLRTKKKEEETVRNKQTMTKIIKESSIKPRSNIPRLKQQDLDDDEQKSAPRKHNYHRKDLIKESNLRNYYRNLSSVQKGMTRYCSSNCSSNRRWKRMEYISKRRIRESKRTWKSANGS